MKITIRCIAPWVAAAAIGAVALAPVAAASTASAPVPQSSVAAVVNSAHAPRPAPKPAPTPFETGEDPLVPFGTDPQVPFRLGYVNPNHDEGNTTNGQVDLPF